LARGKVTRGTEPLQGAVWPPRQRPVRAATPSPPSAVAVESDYSGTTRDRTVDGLRPDPSAGRR
jgi:hypothetical protein